jgi:hypothetical protein
MGFLATIAARLLRNSDESYDVNEVVSATDLAIHPRQPLDAGTFPILVCMKNPPPQTIRREPHRKDTD